MAKKKTDDKPFEGFSYMYDRYVRWVTTITSGKRRSLFIVGLLIIAVLTTLGSLKLVDADWWVWVQTIVAFPAGIILFAILVGFEKTTTVGDWEISKFKEKYSHIQRIRNLAITFAIVAAALIIFGHYLPYGLGGAIMVAALLIGYNALRRTPNEVALATKGIIDPRDIQKDGTISQGAVMDLQNDNGEVFIEQTDITTKDVK